MSSPPVKVLFIVGKGRSGSTILDVTLGEIDGFFSSGEAFWVKNRPSRLPDEMCGCGRVVSSCPVWSAVIPRALAAAVEDVSDHGSREMERCQRSVVRWASVPRLLGRRPGSTRAWPELEVCRRYLGRFYETVAEITGARVLVDSSKWPASPGVLGLVPGIEPYVIHLVRDPRAVAFSWQRVKRYTRDGDPMPVFGATASTVSWLARNLTSEWVTRRTEDRSLRLRYEDFAVDPESTVESVLRLVGEPLADLPFEDGRTIRLGENHALRGNPSRFETGRVTIREDDTWRSELSPWAHRWITALTLLLLRRYDYPLGR